ncbi:MAG: diphthamide biosynthesis enzyme Dph2 [Methanobacteriota archaeon]|nr:MAG: diphthamide biosynthesis enzyme Dph2 [Euryarchaeota archaeon]
MLDRTNLSRIPSTPYLIDKQNILAQIKEHNPKTILLQLPEGLKPYTEKIVKLLKLDRYKLLIHAEPCYGACDIPLCDAARASVDLILHIGHTPMIPNRFLTTPTIYGHVQISSTPEILLNIFSLLKSEEKKMGVEKLSLGLTTTAQHLHLLEPVKKILEEKGFEVHTGKPGWPLAYPGQVLGCNYTAAKNVSDRVHLFLHLSSGVFHAVGVHLATGKPVLALNPRTGETLKAHETAKKFLKQRYASIAKSMDAKNFGIVIGSRVGQHRAKKAEEVMRLLGKHGKNFYSFLLREITPEALLPYKFIDAFIILACPRIAVDDTPRYEKPLLTPIDLEILLNERPWERYELDEILPGDY